VAGFSVQLRADGILYLAGELEMATAEGFAVDVSAHLDGRREVVLDISELSFIDSTGIRALLELARLTAPREVILRHPRPNVGTVLAIVNIESLGFCVER